MESAERRWQCHLVAYGKADALYRQGKVRAAIPAFRVALSLAPKDIDTLWALGDCYSEIGSARKAEHAYRKAWLFALQSDRSELLYNIANARLDQGRPRSALSLYRRIPRGCTAYVRARRNAVLAARMAANSSIERTPSGRLRLPTVTAHVQR